MSTATYLSDRVVRSDEPDAHFLSDRWRREVSDRTDVTKREGIVLTGARTNPVSGMNLPASVVIASNPQFNQGSFDLLISSVDVAGETDLKLALQTSWDDVVNSALANFAVTIDSLNVTVDVNTLTLLRTPFSIDTYPWLASAVDNVSARRYRTAYSDLFGGLDELFMAARWPEVSAILDALCSGDYPAEFAGGAARFSSDAKDRIPRWNEILVNLQKTARSQGLNVAEALGGLIDAI
jgi:hypothetical protein